MLLELYQLTEQQNILSGNITNIGSITGTGVFSAGSYRVSNTEVISSSRNLVNIGTISSGAITASGKIKASGSRFESTTSDNAHREYVLTTGSGGGDFFLGQIEYNDAADGAIKGTIYFAYDYGTSTQNTIVHFTLHKETAQQEVLGGLKMMIMIVAQIELQQFL